MCAQGWREEVRQQKERARVMLEEKDTLILKLRSRLKALDEVQPLAQAPSHSPL